MISCEYFLAAEREETETRRDSALSREAEEFSFGAEESPAEAGSVGVVFSV